MKVKIYFHLNRWPDLLTFLTRKFLQTSRININCTKCMIPPPPPRRSLIHVPSRNLNLDEKTFRNEETFHEARGKISTATETTSIQLLVQKTCYTQLYSTVSLSISILSSSALLQPTSHCMAKTSALAMKVSKDRPVICISGPFRSHDLEKNVLD